MIDIYKFDYCESYWVLVESNFINKTIPIDCIPNKKGVYIFFDFDGNILRIGKAVKLRNRLRSYLRTQSEIDLINRMNNEIGLKKTKKKKKESDPISKRKYEIFNRNQMLLVYIVNPEKAIEDQLGDDWKKHLIYSNNTIALSKKIDEDSDHLKYRKAWIRIIEKKNYKTPHSTIELENLKKSDNSLKLKLNKHRKEAKKADISMMSSAEIKEFALNRKRKDIVPDNTVRQLKFDLTKLYVYTKYSLEHEFRKHLAEMTSSRSWNHRKKRLKPVLNKGLASK
jgi:hypothetical protein